MFKPLENINVAVVGLGYVGLPLAIALSKKFKVWGFDIKANRVKELRAGIDHTKEVSANFILEAIKGSEKSKFIPVDNLVDIEHCDIYLVTVPTPVDSKKAPDLSPLIHACEQLGSIIKKGNIVIFESTVYPGCTEEVCVPILEKQSGLLLNKDFFCGYSPERINPGDKVNTITDIKKVTSGSNEASAKYIDRFYKSFITAGTHLAPNIKVAEASKAIENAQRDLNISFMNELSLIFDKMNIDTQDVLDAAKTKWNFLDFKPGLVGGHCICVDPYYLTYKAQQLGYSPEVILSGRKVNDGMSTFIAQKLVKSLLKKGKDISNCKILILGYTFKENCSDTRNSKVSDVYHELISYNTCVHIFDPWVDNQIYIDSNIKFVSNLKNDTYDAVLIAVGHEIFKNIDFESFKSEGCLIFDTKSFIGKDISDIRL